MPSGLRQMIVESVRVHTTSSQHVVILREAERERYLPIWIGSWEAQSIAMKLQGVEAERPLTHDLLANILGDLGVSIRRVIVSDLADETYRARIILSADGDDHEIDARPSDAIALAVRVAAPIFATEAVLDRASVIPEMDEEERLSVFRDFVNSLGTDAERPGGGERTSGGQPGLGPRQEQLPDDETDGEGDGDDGPDMIAPADPAGDEPLR
jgi:bifunctional DNase/RNase